MCALAHFFIANIKRIKHRSEYKKKLFNEILQEADFVNLINNHYFPGCYQIRNQWMVDRSNLAIAMFNGQKGGTNNTIDYAFKKGALIYSVLD